MPENHDRIRVRRAERIACSFGATLAVSEQSRERVRLARAYTDRDGSVATTTIDCSIGGLALRSTIFIPPGTLVVVSLPGVLDGAEFRAKARVARAKMLDRVPTYMLGMSFEGADARQVQSLLAAARAKGAAA